MTQAFADALNWVPKSPGLGTTLMRAFEYAKAQSHRAVTLEHVLLALTSDVDAGAVFQACGLDAETLTVALSDHLGRLEDRLAPSETADPIAAPDLIRILDYAAAAARQSRRREVNGAVVLAAIVGEGKSAAAHMLRGQGLTFEETIKALQRANTPSRQLPAPAQAAEPRDLEPVNAHAPVEAPLPPRPPSGSQPNQPGSATQPPPWQPTGGVAPQTERRRPEGDPDHGRVPVPQAQSIDQTPAPPFRVPGQGTISHQQPRAEAHSARNGLATDGSTPPLPSPSGGRARVEGGSDVAREEQGASVAAQRRGPPPVSPPSRWPDVLPPARTPGHESRPLPERLGSTIGDRSVPMSIEDLIRESQHRALDRGRRSSPPSPPGTGADKTGDPPLLSHVQPGTLVENIPRNMRVGVGSTIEIRIARADIQALKQGMAGPGAPVEHAIAIAKAMSVQLRAPDGAFFIETVSPETQWVEDRIALVTGDFASWRWTVTPRRSGRARIQLVVAARIVGANGLMADMALPEQIVDVDVDANYGKVFARLGGWIVAAAAGGVLG